jgi:hypothetical protein
VTTFDSSSNVIILPGTRGIRAEVTVRLAAGAAGGAQPAQAGGQSRGARC